MRSWFQQWTGGLSEGLPRPFWALLAGTFVTKAGSFVVPLLFVYLSQARGLPLSTAGLVASLYGVGSVVGVSLGGSLADRLGRKVTMLGSLVLGAASMLALGAAHGVAQLAPATFLLGVTADAYRPASQAVVADLVAPAHRMKAFGLQYWAINLGFSFAALVGGFMATRSFGWLFVGDALTSLVLAAVIALAVPETRPASTGTPLPGSLLTPLVDPRYRLFLVLNFLLVLVFFQHLAGLPEDMRRKGLGTEVFGAVVASNGLWIVLLQPWVTRRVEGAPRHRLLAIASLATGLGFAATHWASSLPTYLLTVALWTFGEILFAPINATIVADLAPTHLRGRYQAAFGLTWALAAAIAPTLGPFVIERAGLGVLWGACAVVGVGVAAVHLSLGDARFRPA